MSTSGPLLLIIWEWVSQTQDLRLRIYNVKPRTSSESQDLMLTHPFWAYIEIRTKGFHI